MNKQIFQIPDGCKAVTVEQVGNQIIITFEPEFKRGDVLISKKGNIAIFDRMHNTYNYFHEIIGLVFSYITKPNDSSFGKIDDFHLATPEEAQRLWDALAKEGKRWNPETIEIEEIEKKRWRANHYKEYYYINPHFEISCEKVDAYDFMDNERYSIGNYFQTKEQAEKALQKLKKMLLIFWKEELNKL